MSKQEPTNEIVIKDNESIMEQQREWKKKGWWLPDLPGGKEKWFPLVKELIELINEEQAANLDTQPVLKTVDISKPDTWQKYASFLNLVGLTNVQNNKLYLTSDGKDFCNTPSQRFLADLIQDKIRLFGEVLGFLAITPSTPEDVNKQFCKDYKLDWKNLSNIRRRMNWLEVLGLIHGIEERKWEATAAGQDALNDWRLVSPEVLNEKKSNPNTITIADPPTEIAALLQRLEDSPELHRQRKTYNIWVPSPNRIDNLRTIVKVTTERISKADLFLFIEERFGLKSSSVESMLPFLKASGLVKEDGRNCYSATPAARAWLETNDDLDFIRILHANMKFVGEMIAKARDDVSRNEIYEEAALYGLNSDKARWIAGFLIEADLLEEPQYLHLKATPLGLAFVAGLPLAEKPFKTQKKNDQISQEGHIQETPPISLEQIEKRLRDASRDPNAEGKPSGVAFEEAIAEIFRFMGFDAQRIGGSGDTDVVVRWHDYEGKSLTAIVDAKSKTSGQVTHNDISDVAIEAHKEKKQCRLCSNCGTKL